MSRSRPCTLPPSQLFEQLEALYEDVDSLTATITCDLSTACCRFGVTGREPYLTSIEEAYLKRAIAARGGPLPSSKRAALWQENEWNVLGARRFLAGGERTCPLLNSEGRCAVYNGRPFGCRTFFCQQASGNIDRRELRDLVLRLQQLASQFSAQGDQSRPMSRVLGIKG